MKNTLPLLSEMILPSFGTIIKGIKIKKKGICIKKNFENVTIDSSSLQSYKNFLNWNTDLPLAFFYLMAQRAQTNLMLSSDFTIAIPGLVHIANTLTSLDEIDKTKPYNLQAKVEVSYKETGSLIPKFTVDFTQNEKTVIRCESTYIAKRKGNKKREHIEKEYNDFTDISVSAENWEISKNLGKKYAQASGDKNPIHSSKLFARIVGFKNPILQGWYSISRIVKTCETEFNTTFKNIEVEFKSPVFLPSKQIAEWYITDEREVIFQVKSDNNKIVLIGKLK